MQVLRKEISNMSKYSNLFLGYHGLFEEIKDTQELMKEAEGDKEMKQLLDEDILRIMGDDENYGQIEEIQEEIIEQILPITKADQQNSCIVEIM